MATMLGNVSVRNVRWKAGLLDNKIDSFRHDLEAWGDGSKAGSAVIEALAPTAVMDGDNAVSL
jgi:hypothetical protein